MSEIIQHQESGLSTINCLNCGHQFEGKFCSQCGQKSATHRFTMHEWLHEIPHSIFHVDSGFFYTAKALFTRPGEAIREYLSGKRKLLFSPFLYLLVMCGIFVAVGLLLPHAEVQVKEVKTLSDSLEYLQSHYYKPMIVAMILPVAIGSFFAYLKSGFNFAEHLVLNMFLIGHMVIVDIQTAFLKSATSDAKLNALIGLLDFGMKYLFWFWTYWQFFKPKTKLRGLLQFLAAIIIFFVVYFSITFIGYFFFKLISAH